MSKELNDADRVAIAKEYEKPWRVISNKIHEKVMRAANLILMYQANNYVECDSYGSTIRIVMRRDLPKYGIAYDVPGLSMASILEADEHMAKPVVATGNLYQLPNGQWITPSMVLAVAAHTDQRGPYALVCFCADGGSHEIDCQTKEAAEAMRDKIAADVNAMVGGV